MSSTVLLVAGEAGEFDDEFEFRNSWLGAAYIWRALWDKYGEKKHKYDSFLENIGKLFDGVDHKMTDVEKIVLMSTADRVTVKGDDLTRLAKSFEEFVALHPVEGDHLPPSLIKQSAKLRELYEQTPRPRAVAWNQTTVNSNPWTVVIGCDRCGCECNPEFRPYSLDTDDNHWDLFTEWDEDRETKESA